MPSNSRCLLFQICITLALATPPIACSKKYHYKEDAVPERVTLSPQLEKIFQNTKLVCFGRYALALPKEAELIWGSASFPSKISSFPGSLEDLKEIVAKDIEKIKYNDKGAEITYNNPGPIEFSWQIRYFDTKGAKQLNLLFLTPTLASETGFFALETLSMRGSLKRRLLHWRIAGPKACTCV